MFFTDIVERVWLREVALRFTILNESQPLVTQAFRIAVDSEILGYRSSVQLRFSESLF